ncbi:MAG: 4Fe-4S binding protein [Halobacteriota archaeon]
MMWIPVVDRMSCIGCGKCAEVKMLKHGLRGMRKEVRRF